MKYLPTLLSAACLLTGCINLENTRSPTSKAKKKIIEIGTKPESICRGFQDKLFVTMIGGDEPGDGAIYVLDGDEPKPFASGFNSPKGIAFVKGFLITADETTVWKVNGKGKATKLAEADDFPAEVEFLNDVAANHERDAVYVTEMSHPKRMFNPEGERELWPLGSEHEKNLPKTGCVYKITLDGKITVAVPPGDPRMPGPNGVTVAGSKEKPFLVMGDFFTGNIVAYQDGKMRLMAKNLLRGADAVAFDRKGILYVSSWSQGKVIKYHRKEKKSSTVMQGLTTAADFYLDRKASLLVVPDMLEGKLHILPLE
tara:strand:- start:209 stop:1147 length:939 start_codon:yes stop_codon:yes gene_type:complete